MGRIRRGREKGGLWAAALALCLGTAAVGGQPADRAWTATWGTAQQYFQVSTPAPPTAPAASAPPPAPATPVSAVPGVPARRFGIPPRITGLNNQTVRMIARTSLAGDAVRIRLFNAIGGRSVRIGAAHVALRRSGSAIVPGSDRALTFSGSPSVTMYAGQTLVSDPVTLSVPALADVAVSLHLPGETGGPTSHLFGLRDTYISREGDFTAATEITELDRTTQSYYWLAGIDVLAPPTAGVLVTLGDSITDGDQSTPDTNGPWPSLLAARLQANPATRGVGVVNAGISGNRMFGDNGSVLVRFDQHVLTVPGVRWMTLLIGINDITGATRGGAAPTLTAAELIAAYKQIVQRAHARGIRVIGCTITPYGGSNVYTEAGEAIRDAANQWIRTSGTFDAVVDFDAATRDARDPKRFRPEADSPDLLHPGDAGYRLMAQAFDLAVFAPPRVSPPRR